MFGAGTVPLKGKCDTFNQCEMFLECRNGICECSDALLQMNPGFCSDDKAEQEAAAAELAAKVAAINEASRLAQLETDRIAAEAQAEANRLEAAAKKEAMKIAAAKEAAEAEAKAIAGLEKVNFLEVGEKCVKDAQCLIDDDEGYYNNNEYVPYGGMSCRDRGTGLACWYKTNPSHFQNMHSSITNGGCVENNDCSLNFFGQKVMTCHNNICVSGLLPGGIDQHTGEIIPDIVPVIPDSVTNWVGNICNKWGGVLDITATDNCGEDTYCDTDKNLNGQLRNPSGTHGCKDNGKCTTFTPLDLGFLSIDGDGPEPYGICRLSDSAKNIPDGEFCNLDSQCKSGACAYKQADADIGEWNFGMDHTCSAKGEICKTLGGCGYDNYCKIKDGNTSNGCNSGYCKKGSAFNICRNNIPGDAQEGEYCDADKDCTGELGCRGNICVVLPPRVCSIGDIPECFNAAKKVILFIIFVIIFWYIGRPLLSLIGKGLKGINKKI